MSTTNPRRTEELTPRPHQIATGSTTAADRRPGVSFATKRGFLVQGRSFSPNTQRHGSRKNSPAQSSSVNTEPTFIPGTKSAIKRLAPLTPRDSSPALSPPTSPHSPAYRPNLQELGVRYPERWRHLLGLISFLAKESWSEWHVSPLVPRRLRTHLATPLPK